MWLWFQYVCPLMPSGNTYHLTWVSLTLVMGYLFTSAPAKHSHCSLPWTRGISSRLLPDLACGIVPLDPPEPVQPLLLGRGVTYLSHHPRPRAWGTSSWQLLHCPSLAHTPAAPDLCLTQGSSTRLLLCCHSLALLATSHDLGPGVPPPCRCP